MKKFITKTILTIIIPLFILLTTAEVLLRKAPNNYSYKYKCFNTECKSTKILFLGSSHCECSFDCRYFSMKGFNMGSSSQSYQVDDLLFSRFFPKMDSLKYVVLVVSYFTPFIETSDLFMTHYCIDYKLHLSKKPKYNLNIMSFDRHSFNTIVNYVKGNKKDINIDTTGYRDRSLMEKKNVKNWELNGRNAAKDDTFKPINWSFYNKNYYYVNDIIQKCKTKNIKVILITTPKYYTYRKYINSTQLSFMYAFVNKITKNNSNTLYWNYSSDTSFHQDCFMNSDHLNDKGAKRFSIMINSRIKSLN